MTSVMALHDRSTPVQWQLIDSDVPPKFWPAENIVNPGVKSLFYQAMPWKGRSTQTFAWLGIPEGQGPFPGIVLVHGGTGTAFANWVTMWVQRGYAAIAMDTCGCVPTGQYDGPIRHDQGGPPGWGGYEQINQPLQDQWTYHAVADVILARRLLAADSRVDASRIGMHGVSWGGYLACVTSGIDHYFQFAISSYGAGCFGKFGPSLAGEDDPKDTTKWFEAWDASHYLSHASIPMLWISPPNDFAFPLPSQWASSDLVTGPTTMSIRVGMPHDQSHGSSPIEAHVFADQQVNHGPAISKIIAFEAEERELRATIDQAKPIQSAHLAFTTDYGPWSGRQWQTIDTHWDMKQSYIQATVPREATAAYLAMIDIDGCLISTRPKIWQDHTIIC